MNKVQYYVGSLMPPLEPSCVVTGSKLRRMSEIPGRGNTTVLLQAKLVSMYDVSGSLMPPLELSCVVTGSKLRRMSEIPGRGNTTVLLQGKLVSVWGIISVRRPSVCH